MDRPTITGRPAATAGRLEDAPLEASRGRSPPTPKTRIDENGTTDEGTATARTAPVGGETE